MIFRRRSRDLHLRTGRIGADHAEIAARLDTLMTGAGGQDCNVAGLDLKLLAVVAAETDASAAAPSWTVGTKTVAPATSCASSGRPL